MYSRGLWGNVREQLFWYCTVSRIAREWVVWKRHVSCQKRGGQWGRNNGNRNAKRLAFLWHLVASVREGKRKVRWCSFCANGGVIEEWEYTQRGCEVWCNQCSDRGCTALRTACDRAANYYACKKITRIKLFWNKISAFLVDRWFKWGGSGQKVVNKNFGQNWKLLAGLVGADRGRILLVKICPKLKPLKFSMSCTCYTFLWKDGWCL